MEKNKIVYLDGGMGTMLQKRGLEPGHCPEILNLTNPDTVMEIHLEYLNAGSDVVYANTFGANRYKTASTGYSVRELISAGVSCAKEAVERAGKSGRAKVALDIGPIGQMLEPYGTLSFEEAYDIHAEMLEAGAAAGADLVVFETMTDLYEVKAAVLAAKEHTDLPVYVTMTFEENGRTFTGCSVEAMAAVLNGLEVDAMGINCSLGPKEIFPIAQRLAQKTDRQLIVKANAGLPDPATGVYHITPEEFGAAMVPYLDLGVSILGGCCGTTPEFVRQICEQTAGKMPAERSFVRESLVCTPTCVVPINGVRVIGERLNPTGKKRFRQAILEGELDYIVRQAVEQADAGADILDVNVGVPGVDESEMIIKVIKAVQEVTDLPIQIDSSSVEALEAGLRIVNGKPIINSVNGEAEKLEKILPLAKKYGAAVIGLAMDENGIPATAEERFVIAERILNAALSYGIPREDVYIDCLTLTVSAEQEKAIETLRAMDMVHDRLGLHCVLGVSNISFGLPCRDLITSGFLTLAMDHGLDLPIVNPNSVAIMDAIRVYNVLMNRDRNAEKYIEACGNRAQTAVSAPVVRVEKEANHSFQPLVEAVVKGLKDESRRETAALLESGMTEVEVIDGLLIPALDIVGERYEKGSIFLPQLINSAAAAQEGFEVIKKAIAKRGGSSVSKGKILVATVKGDIHDIGKNIVKTILENYGYSIVDLGRDVPVEEIVETAIREDIRLIGLSALMTTTLVSMADTIRALRESGHPCKIWVGGAVLTPEYAKEIGADFYARDAKESADIAKKVLGS